MSRDVENVQTALRENNLAALCDHINALTKSPQIIVHADLNGTDCPISHVEPFGDEIEVYGPDGYFGTYPDGTAFIVQLSEQTSRADRPVEVSDV